MFEWMRALHIISMIAWMAGLLMLPRLMVYRLEGVPGGETDLMMEKAIKRLRMIIINPAMILTWVFGIGLLSSNWGYYSTQPWIYVKLVAVLGISALHGMFVGMSKKIGTEKAPKPKMLRMLNEVPFLLAIVAVIMVVVQPFS